MVIMSIFNVYTVCVIPVQLNVHSDTHRFR